MYLVWKALEETFPGWEVHHTGGGVFVIRRDFINLKGEPVLVSVSVDVAIVMKDVEDSSRYVTHTQFLKNEGVYWEKAFHLELVIMEAEESGVRTVDCGHKLFTASVLEEISKAMQNLAQIIWGEE